MKLHKIKQVMFVTFIIMAVVLFVSAALADNAEGKNNDKQSGPIIIIIANGSNLSTAELKKELQSKLNEMVASGKITREQADKILQNNLIYQQPGQEVGQRITVTGKMDNQVIAELKKQLQIKLDEMVAIGKITREQADGILQNTFIDQQPGQMIQRRIFVTGKMDHQVTAELKREIQIKLDEMVAIGKITREQADGILQNTFIDQQPDQKVMIIGKRDKLSKEELKDVLQIKLDQMVARGKITREQADEILQ